MTDTTGAPPHSNQPILLRQDSTAGITTLTLNRPDKRNALSTELIVELDRTLEAISEDRAVKVAPLARVHARVRAVVPTLTDDRPPAPDIDAIAGAIADGSLESACAAEVK